VKVDVEDSGTVKLASPNYEAIEKAIYMIKRLTQEVEVGGLYTGRSCEYWDLVPLLNFSLEPMASSTSPNWPKGMSRRSRIFKRGG